MKQRWWNIAPGSESTWYWAALLTGMVSVCSVVIAAGATLHQEFSERYEVIQLWQPFVTFFLAATTFSTVVWRGLISSRQADMQREQLDKLGEQISSAEENNLANLLEKAGALFDSEKSAQHTTGLALLRYIGVAKLSPFRDEAARLLLSFINEKTIYNMASDEGVVVEYLKQIHNRSGTIYRTQLTVEIADLEYFLPHLNGVIYGGAYFKGVTIKGLQANRYIDCDFEQCVFIDTIYADEEARFVDCKMRSVLRPHRKTPEAKNHLAEFRYERCDFSGAKALARHANHYFKECFYSPEDPPSDRILELAGSNLVERTVAGFL